MSVRILVGDVLVRLREIPDATYDQVVTSPPYWGLRDYGVDGQLGLEPTLGEHLAAMVAVFDEIWRVLKPTGTLWLNYGDCYATQPNGRSAADTKRLSDDDRTFRDKPFSTVGPIYSGGDPSSDRRGTRSTLNGAPPPDTPGRIIAGGVLKPKDLCMVPNRLAIALQEAGWWVRSEIVWGKSNPMPESIDDRPATAHEKIFLLSKSGKTTLYRARDSREWSSSPDLSERLAAPTEDDPDVTVNRWRGFDYYYDADAVRMGRTQDEDAKTFRGGSYVGGEPGMRAVVGNKRQPKVGGWAGDGEVHHQLAVSKGDRKTRGADHASPRQAGHINHTGIEGTPRGEGRNLRNYEPAPLNVWRIATRPFSEAHFATFPPDLAARCIAAGCPPGGTVLDPFGGAGTTGLVADGMGRSCDMIELNPEYARLALDRLQREFGMMGDVEIVE